MDTCGICGFPKASPNRAMGYAGNLCTGHEPFLPPPLTADDVRKIVREELDRHPVKKGGPDYAAKFRK